MMYTFNMTACTLCGINNMKPRATTTVRNGADYGSPFREPGNWFRHHKRFCGLFVTSTRARIR